MHEKLAKVLRLGYIKVGPVVRSLTNYFAVPKVVLDGNVVDVRMVYDGTKSGLNDALWSPNFCLPTIDTVLQATDVGAWHGNLDLGDMF